LLPLPSQTQVTTGYQENEYLFAKPSARHTNNHPSQRLQQVVAHSKRVDAIRRIIEGERQRAKTPQRCKFRYPATRTRQQTTGQTRRVMLPWRSVHVPLLDLQLGSEAARSEEAHELLKTRSRNAISLLHCRCCGSQDEGSNDLCTCGRAMLLSRGCPSRGGVKVGSDIYEGNVPKYVAFRTDGYIKETPAEWYAEIIALFAPFKVTPWGVHMHSRDDWKRTKVRSMIQLGSSYG
jgi:hypothetical protein